MRAKTGIWK